MLKMSGRRDTLKKRWDSALAIYDKMDIVDETEVKRQVCDECCFLGCDSHNDPVSNFIPDRGKLGQVSWLERPEMDI